MIGLDIEGKMNFLAGCASSSDDGWTYLNDDARAAIKEAAATLRKQARDIDQQQRQIKHLEDLVSGYKNLAR